MSTWNIRSETEQVSPGAAETEGKPEAVGELATTGVTLDEIVETTAAVLPERQAPPIAAVAMCTARVVSMEGKTRRASILARSANVPVLAEIAPDVDLEVIEDARANGDAVLVETCEGEPPLIIAALRTRRPRELRLRGEKISIEGSKEVMLRSGFGALRIHESGDIELVGGTINAVSRGLFRLVGRLVRLN
ncbi:hypothetical protein WME95_11835 [Sorangium sp. So ce327]|uniref:hypothetical protein n=1 Tax=Sorangium sp. So ce327 TaxID=3133301 RepID=UPI003F637D46